MDFRRLCLKTGITNITTDTEVTGIGSKLKELKEVKHSIRYVEKVRVDNGIGILIYYSNNKEAIYFSNSNKGRNFYNKIRRLINIKV